jgi:hypothetical protein
VKASTSGRPVDGSDNNGDEASSPTGGSTASSSGDSATTEPATEASQRGSATGARNGARSPTDSSRFHVIRSREFGLKTALHVVQPIQRINLITRRSRVRIPPSLWPYGRPIQSSRRELRGAPEDRTPRPQRPASNLPTRIRPAIAGSAGAGWIGPAASLRAEARLRSARTWAATARRRAPGAPHCPVRPRLSSLRASRGRCKAQCCPGRAHRDAGFAVATCRGSAWACLHLAGPSPGVECGVPEGVEARGWHAPNRCDGGGRPPPGGR